MKKALVVFLLLALVGGGLFAQEGLTFSGLVDVGVGMIKLDGVDDATVGLINHDQGWADGTFAHFTATYNHPDGKSGFQVRLQTLASPGNWASGFQFRRAHAWISGLDGMIKLVGGRIAPNEVAGVDYVNGANFFNSYGLITYLYPLPDMLTIGVGLRTPQALDEGKIFDDVGIWAGLLVNLDMLDASAQLRTQKDDTRAAFSVAVKGLPVDVDAAFEAYRIDDFSNVGIMDIYGHVGFELVGLGLDVSGRFSKSNEYDDPFYIAGLEANYPIGNIVPSLFLAYAQGGAYEYAGLQTWNSYWGETYNKDQTFVSVTPAIQLRVASNKYVKLGAVINKDLGDVAATGGKDGMNLGAFANLRVTW